MSYSDANEEDGGAGMTNVEAPASRPLRKDAARNRDLLIRAAREVFAARGLEASLDEVAHHAGLGVGTAYRHFANKYDLAQAIFADGVDEIIRIAEKAAAADDPWAGIVEFLEETATRQSTDRGLREVLMGVHDAEELQRVNERISVPLRRIVDRAKAQGAIRQDIESTDIGVIVLMLCTVADITADLAPDLWRRYLPMLLDGLRSGTDLAVPAASEELMHEAMATYKRRIARLTRG